MAKKSIFQHPSKICILQSLRSRLFSAATNIEQSKHFSIKTKTFSHIYQECKYQGALNPGKQAHARMITSGFMPTVFVTNCLIQMYTKCSNLSYGCKVFDRMPHRDVISWNAMVFAYASCGKMEVAEKLFDEMGERDLVSWNSMISGYLQSGDCRKSIQVFERMGRLGTGFDGVSFAVCLKTCAVLQEYEFGIQVHGLAFRMGFVPDVMVASALVDMYAKCNHLDDSVNIFREISEKNAVSWSALIAGCVQNNQFLTSLEIFKENQSAGVEVNQSIYASVFRSSASLTDLRFGTQVHAHALKTNFASDVIVGTASLDMYAKCNSMTDACKIFTSLPDHSLQSYNAMIIGYARNNKGYDALHWFLLLLKSKLGFNEISLSGVFSACAITKRCFEGMQIHGLAIKSMLVSNISVANAILDMYGKCGSLSESCLVFEEMKIRDAVSYNAIITAHEQNKSEETTLSLFVSMLHSGMEPDEFTYGSVLKVCANQPLLNYGVEIHSRIIKCGLGMNIFVGSSLIDMYCKCGVIEEAEKIRDRICDQNVVSWNSIISGFSSQKQSEDAQRYFSRMLEMGLRPDNFTYATVLDTCANLATVGLGKQIHAQVIKQELQSDAYICSTLVDMYSKCGNMNDSILTFQKSPNRDFVTWNAMICGFAHHGQGPEALRIFENMLHEHVKPNHATFVSVLRACAHMGLAEKGLQYFDAMQFDYSLNPQMEHYSCMVDILGRSGKVNEAMKLIQEMPFEADAIIWRTLLSICKTQGNVDVAEKAAMSILKIEPDDSSAYVLLSNIYADAGMWDKVSELRKLMRRKRLRKEPGCSWIEIKDSVHTFLVDDKAHPKCEEIFEKLDLLICEMKGDVYVPDVDTLLCEGAL
ncbi:hypothetical protein ACFE04_006997 [Oxalis oulophora]